MQLFSLSFRAACLACLLIGSALGQSNDDIIRIEEQWRLKVINTASGSASPQITSAFAPVRQGDVLYATFSINHHSCNEGEFCPGGIQIQLWHGECLLGQKTAGHDDLLMTAGEEITWKQVISLHNGIVRFSIKGGKSETYGSFGDSLRTCFEIA